MPACIAGARISPVPEGGKEVGLAVPEGKRLRVDDLQATPSARRGGGQAATAGFGASWR